MSSEEFFATDKNQMNADEKAQSVWRFICVHLIFI
jgi:hypothetical protein